VTHTVTEAVFLAGRVVVLGHGGRVVATEEVPMTFPRPPEARYGPELAAAAARVHTHLRAAAAPEPAR
jgi:NitT/TauT family transport system ATP-binding protein